MLTPELAMRLAALALVVSDGSFNPSRHIEGYLTYVLPCMRMYPGGAADTCVPPFLPSTGTGNFASTCLTPSLSQGTSPRIEGE